MGICKVEGCGKPMLARGWCTKHYQRWKIHGRTDNRGKLELGSPPEVRFFALVKKAKNGCWLWQAHRSPSGYGDFKVRRKTWRAHRWAYQHFVAPIPDGFHVHHRCASTNCVNPEHLECVSLEEHAQTRLYTLKKRCPKGHPYKKGNMYFGPTGHPRCRTCVLEAMKKWYEVRGRRLRSRRKLAKEKARAENGV